MACKMTVTAAASILILALLSQSGVEAVGLQGGGCTVFYSRMRDCTLCKLRCMQEGSATGFCDGKKECVCVECSAHKPPTPVAAGPRG